MDSETSQKALNNIMDMYSRLHTMNDVNRLSDSWNEVVVDNFRDFQLPRNEEVKIFRKFDSNKAINQVGSGEEDKRLFELIQLIEKLKSEIKDFRPKQTKNVQGIQLVLKNDYLEIQIRELNYKVESMENNIEVLKKSHQNISDDLGRVHLKNEFQINMDAIQEELYNTTNDYLEARSLIKELQKVAWVMLPAKVAISCENMENKMDEVKSKLEQFEMIIYKKRLKISKLRKQIYALNLALTSELWLKDAYKKQIEKYQNLKHNMQENLNKLSNGIRITNKNLLSDEPLHKSSGLVAAENIENNSEDNKVLPRISKVGNEEKLEFLQEKLMNIAKKIISVTNDLEQKTKDYNLLHAEAESASNIKTEINKLVNTRKQLSIQLEQEVILRKSYYNQIEDLKGKIRVFCRCRPISQTETNKGCKQCVSFPDTYTVVIHGVNRDSKGKEFQFDKVFPPKCLQEDIFQDTSKLLQSAFDGFNVCIFAYGQTGSGKTFTLIGNIEDNPGIVLRTFDRIFEIANEGKLEEKHEYYIDVQSISRVKFSSQVQCYMLELYNEKLLDLMSDNAVYSDKLEIKKDSNGMVFVGGAELLTANDNIELRNMFKRGNSNRHIAETKMSSESSRSHLIVSVLITCYIRNSDKKIRGKISIIDLAGSERLAKSGVHGVGVQEAMCINMSLSALGDVISALTTGQIFIPYRNNKLTMLMQDSIGGNAKTLMFVNISPVDFNGVETMNSLTYGTRVKLIKNDVNKVSGPDEIPKLLKIIERLEKGDVTDFNLY